MKQKAFEIAQHKGYAEDAAKIAWEKVKENCGAEPTAAMLADYDRDAYLTIGVPRPLAVAWSEAFTKDAAPARGRKFKADKARTYSHAEIVAFVAADPKADGLQAEAMRRSGGESFLFYVGGKLDEAVSAERLRALYERDPVAPFVRIGEADVKPSAYPADAAKEDAEDPFQRGVALGQPGNVSARLGVSLDGIAHETQQAIDCAMQHDLSDASKTELIRAAGAAKGKSAAEWLADYPNARREWPAWKRRSLKIARAVRGPFVEPVAPTAKRTGQTTAAAPSDNEIVSAIISAGLERRALLAGLPVAFVASLHTAGSPAAQHQQDYHEIKRVGRLRDGTDALGVYLANAERAAAGRSEADVFRRALTPQQSGPVLCIVTGGDTNPDLPANRAGNALKKRLAPAIQAGALRVIDDYTFKAGEFVSEERARRLAEATVLVAVVCMDTLANDTFCDTIASGKRLLPVVTDGGGMVKYNPTLSGLRVIDGRDMAAAAQAVLDAVT